MFLISTYLLSNCIWTVATIDNLNEDDLEAFEKSLITITIEYFE